MLEAAIVVAVPAFVAATHVLPLHAIAPRVAATIWLAALALRALVGIALAIFAFLYLPQSSLFAAFAHHCWHDVLPLVGLHLGLSGHGLAHTAVVLPALAIAASALWFAFGLARALRALARYTAQRTVASGPLGSLVVCDEEVVLGVAALGRGQVVVSDAALRHLDQDELRAGLSHELGHLRRGHRPLLLLGSICHALGRVLPGTARAKDELAFNLERDADEYALDHAHDPLTLASAICKSATAPVPAAMAALAGRGRATLRLDYLIAGGRRRRSRTLERAARLLAGLMVITAIGLATTLPAWALQAPAGDSGDQVAGSCQL